MLFSNFILTFCLGIDARLHQKTGNSWCKTDPSESSKKTVNTYNFLTELTHLESVRVARSFASLKTDRPTARCNNRLS